MKESAWRLLRERAAAPGYMQQPRLGIRHWTESPYAPLIEEDGMAWEQREGDGTLWPNRKQSERSPDYSGDALVDGKKRRVLGWWKPLKNGGKFLSLAIKDFDEQRQEPGEDAEPPPF